MFVRERWSNVREREVEQCLWERGGAMFVGERWSNVCEREVEQCL